MDSHWQQVYITDKIHRAEIVRSILDDNQIASVIVDKRDSSYLVGDIELYVRPEDVILSKLIIEQHSL